MKAGEDLANGYRRITINRKLYLEHRVIFFLHSGYWPKIIDHIDQDKRNNRIENLREATHSLNIHNQRGWASSGLRGAYKRRNGKFLAGITKNGKQHWLGTFASAEEAHRAHLEAASRLF
jgi:hypothetical protein